MATAQQLADNLFADVDRRYTIAGVHNKVITFIGIVATENDARLVAGDPVVPASAVVRVIKEEAERVGVSGQYHFWGTGHVDRVCAEHLSRTSFVDPTPVA